MLRKLRGALGTALTWAVGWAVTAFAASSVAFLFIGRGLWLDLVLQTTAAAAIFGLAGGATFSLVLGAIPWRRRLTELRARRMALWGAGAGLLAPVALTFFAVATGARAQADVLAFVMLLFSGLGAATAGGTVKLAQQASKRLGDTDEPHLIG